jgi:hypothetical protein
MALVLTARASKSPIVEIILSLLLKSQLLIPSLQEHIKSSSTVISIAAIELQTRIVASIDTNLLRGYLRGLILPLSKALNKESVEIRKTAVECFVFVKILVGSEIDEYLSQLLGRQQKLMGLYYSRRIQAQ